VRGAGVPDGKGPRSRLRAAVRGARAAHAEGRPRRVEPVRSAVGMRQNRHNLVRELSPTAWTDRLAEAPLFAGLSKRHVRAIAKVGEMRRYRPGQPIIQTGRAGDAFFLVLEGSV